MTEHEHCWHLFRGGVMIVLPDGYIVQKCCKCSEARQVHAEHVGERNEQAAVHRWR